MVSFIELGFCSVEFEMAKSIWTAWVVPSSQREAGVQNSNLGTRNPTSTRPASVAGKLGLVSAFQRKKLAEFGTRVCFPGFIEPGLVPDLTERAEIAAKQMRYFGLIAQKLAFGNLLSSAKRAGFALLSKDVGRKEMKFQWAAGEPDFIFSVSFEDPDRVTVIAESYRDISGLVLVSVSHVPNISIETKPSLGNHELGPYALQFRNILLAFPDFDQKAAWTKY
jgi:hypothetical protein